MSERIPSVSEILELVARECGVTVINLRGRLRMRSVARPRQLAMWLARQTTLCSLPEIGRHLGDKHHTSVMHGIAKIDELRETHPKTRELSDRLLAILRSPAGHLRLIA